MHNHNNESDKDGGHKGMMWMIIPCLLLLGVLFFGGGKLSSGGYLWPILIGVFVVAHVWTMFRGHGGNSTDTNESKDRKHKHGGCCH